MPASELKEQGVSGQKRITNPDGDGIVAEGTAVGFDNAGTSLTSDNAQDAIVETAASVPGVDNVTVELSSGDIQIKDGGVTFVKRIEYLRKYAISGAVAQGSTHTITAVLTVGTWAAVASNQQQVPEAGTYAINITGKYASASVTNPTVPAIGLKVNSVVQTDGWGQTRWSATPGNTVSLAGTCYVQITTPASEKIEFYNASSGAGTGTPSADLVVTIRKVST